jgi:hypothetical protein
VTDATASLPGRLPGLVLLGAPKCGTSSLASWWDEQPQGFTAPGEEVGFFWPHWDRGLRWYASNFSGAAPGQVTCDASPGYLYFPEALDRIKDVLPDARLAVVLRDPVARAWSHWCHMVTLGLEPRRFSDVLDQEAEDESVTPPKFPIGYLHGSRYLPRLKEVCERFDRSQLLVLFTEDLRADPAGTFARLCRHGGITPGEPGVSRNEGRFPRSPQLQRQLTRMHAGRWPFGLGRKLFFANLRPGPPPAMNPSHRVRLEDLLRPELPALQDWLGMDLPAKWGVPQRLPRSRNHDSTSAVRASPTA